MPFSVLPNGLSPSFSSVVLVQDTGTIGWEGFWTTGWEETQAAYLLSLQSNVTVKHWMTEIIRHLWQISRDLSENRNSFVHDKEQGRLVRSLNATIMEQFQIGVGSLLRPDRTLFRRNLQTVLAYSISNKQVWVNRVMAARHRSAAAALESESVYGHKRRLIYQWLHPS